jgi:hypothetical protein
VSVDVINVKSKKAVVNDMIDLCINQTECFQRNCQWMSTTSSQREYETIQAI